MKFAKKTVEKLVMAYCLEKQTIRKKAGSFQILYSLDIPVEEREYNKVRF